MLSAAEVPPSEESYPANLLSRRRRDKRRNNRSSDIDRGVPRLSSKNNTFSAQQSFENTEVYKNRMTQIHFLGTYNRNKSTPLF